MRSDLSEEVLLGLVHQDWGESILSGGNEEGSIKTQVQKASSRSRMARAE